MFGKFFKNKKKEPLHCKPSLYLHIGMGKTGTTALQEFFWENRGALAENGICYPDYCAEAGAHHRLSPHVPEFLKHVWNFESVEKWAPTLAKLEFGKILLSSELIAWVKPEIIPLFCAELGRWFDVYVVIYLRRQDNLIMAGYNQQIKAGTQRKDIYSVLENQFKRFDYRSKIMPWVESIGKEKIIVRPYERQQFHCGDIRLDFINKVFGIECLDGFKLPSEEGNSNPRLSYVAMEYKRSINNVIEDVSVSSRFNELLLDYSAETDGSSTSIYASKPLLPPRVRLNILNRCEDINSWVAKDFLGRDDGVLFYDELPNESDDWSHPSVPIEAYQNISSYIKSRDLSVYSLLPDSFLNMHSRQLVIHFGTHKTGSSSIQRALSSIVSKDFNYIYFDEVNSSSLLNNAFLTAENLQKKRRFSLEQYDKIRQLARGRLADLMSSSSRCFDVLSAESISNFEYNELKDLVFFSRGYYKNVKFVGYVREPVSYSLSVFQETLKRRPFEHPNLVKGKFTEVIDNLDRLVGRGNVDVFLFDPSSFNRGDVVNHFLENIGVEFNVKESVYFENESLELNALKALYIYRTVQQESELELSHPKSLFIFISILNRLGGGKFFIKKCFFNTIRSELNFIEEWMVERLGIKELPAFVCNETGVGSVDEMLYLSDKEIESVFLLAKSFGVSVSDFTLDVDGVSQCVRALRQCAINLYNEGCE